MHSRTGMIHMSSPFQRRFLKHITRTAIYNISLHTHTSWEKPEGAVNYIVPAQPNKKNSTIFLCEFCVVKCRSRRRSQKKGRQFHFTCKSEWLLRSIVLLLFSKVQEKKRSRKPTPHMSLWWCSQRAACSGCVLTARSAKRLQCLPSSVNCNLGRAVTPPEDHEVDCFLHVLFCVVLFGPGTVLKQHGFV